MESQSTLIFHSWRRIRATEPTRGLRHRLPVHQLERHRLLPRRRRQHHPPPLPPRTYLQPYHTTPILTFTPQERICPLATGLGSTFNETYFTEYQDAVKYTTMRGAYAIIDPHNYYRYNDPSAQPSSGSIIGNTTDAKAASTADFAAFWAELATRFAPNPNVILALMSEPHDMPTELILANNQAAIDAIRKAGAEQLILVPGNGFTGAQRWLNSTCAGCTPNAEVLKDMVDPGANFAFDMHLYFDNDTSGTHEICTLAAPANIAATTTWLAQHNYTAFLSEFGAGSNAVCGQTLNNTLTWLEEHTQWIGWTYWAAGPLWGDYFLSVEPGVGRASNST